MKVLHIVAYLVLFIGGLNWGLIGLFHFNLVAALFGSMPMIENLIYILVGLATIYIIITHKSDCKVCGIKTTKTKK